MTSSVQVLDEQGIDQIGRIETRGVDYIPEAERHSHPKELIHVFFGTQLCFGIIVLGFLPVSFGLGWWGSISSTLVGLAVGSAIFAPLSLLSARTGTNSPVSSSAHFGVVGRLVGSLVGVFTAVGFLALTVWTGGEALVSGGHKLFGTPSGNGALSIAYIVIAVITLAISVFGHANVVLANRILIPSMGILMIVCVIILAPKFTTSPAHTPLLLNNYTATWLLGATTACSLPISYSPYVGDYTRYISPRSWSQKRIMLSAGVGMFAGCAVALCFAIYVAMSFGAGVTDWVAGLVNAVPAAGAIAIMLIALVGSCAQGALCMYGTGLDTSSIFPVLKRVPATLAIGALAVATVFVGTFVYSLVSLATAFLVFLLVVTAPWLVINVIGYVLCRGRYYAYELQVFNMSPRIRAGAYWFHGGWNLAAMLAWIPAIVIGLLFVNTTIYTGPWANVLNGIDLSFISSAVIGGVLYAIFLKVMPSALVRPASVSEDENARRLIKLLGHQESRRPIARHVVEPLLTPEPPASSATEPIG